MPAQTHPKSLILNDDREKTARFKKLAKRAQ
jgi:hypothetical protein